MTRAVIFAGLVITAVYVMSVGPAVWLQTRGYIGLAPLQTIYQPVVAVANTCRPLTGALHWYLSLFALPIPPPPPVSTTPLPHPVASPASAAPMPMPRGLRPATGALPNAADDPRNQGGR
jgi:hypothetical protein